MNSRQRRRFCDVGKSQVFMPADWRDWPGAKPRHYVRIVGEESVALRVTPKNGKWQPSDVRPLMAETSFFPPEEAVIIAGQYHR